MTPEAFRWLCKELWPWPGSWATGAAEALCVSIRNVHFWAAGTKPIPPGVVDELAAELLRRVQDPRATRPSLEIIRFALDSARGTSARMT